MYFFTSEPNAVTSLAVTSTVSAIQVTWAAPTSGALTGYRVEVTADGGSVVHTEEVSGVLQYDVITSISPGTAYTVSVSATVDTADSDIQDTLYSTEQTQRITTRTFT